MRRVKCLQYVNGWLVELDLGVAPEAIEDNVSFEYVHEGVLYRRCYVEVEHDDTPGVFKTIGAVIVAACVCAAALFLFLL